MRLEHARWPEVEDYLRREDRLLLPVGSLEQHGPAVALGIDALIPEAISREAGARTGLYVAPTLTYGMSLHHAAFAGTVSLRPSVYVAMLVDLWGFLVQHGFRRLVVVNGHGGNVPALKAAAAEVSYLHEGARVLISTWADLPRVKERVEEQFGPYEGTHATPSETSLLMYLQPELVGDVTQVEMRAGGVITWQPGPKDLRDYYPQGVVGSDPKLASAELGRELFGLAVEGVVELTARV